MDQQAKTRKLAAVKTADTINAIEGIPVSDYVRSLSDRWVKGEVTGDEMKAALLEHYRKMAQETRPENRH